jgi:AmmeMemoRadiSam system protein A
MPPYLTEEERRELLAIARRAASAFVREGKMPEEAPASPRLSAPGAAFVTLTEKGLLRGCIGYTEAAAPLYRTIQECVVAAATEDPRFPAVEPSEVDSVRIEISVLTPLVPVLPEEVEVGVHGLMVRKGRRRGLLLPQVPEEFGWDRRAFLSNVCRKAGLHPDEWTKGAELYSFTAEVFGEPPRKSPSPSTSP